MGLKFSDALRLSWSNIAQHKKQSAIIILTTSLLFGVIMGFNFITSGMEKTVISATAGQTGGKVYMEVSHGKRSDSWAEDVTGPEEVGQANLVPTLDEASDQKIRELATRYGGEVNGYYWCYHVGYSYCVIDKKVVEQFIDARLWGNMPDGKVPAIMSEGWEPPVFTYNGETDTSLRDRIGDSLYRVGSISGTEDGSPTLEGFNPLNLILEQLSGARDYEFWLIDDGSGRIEAFIRDQMEKYFAEGYVYRLETIRMTVVAEFSDLERAVACIDFVEDNSTSLRYGVSDLFGTTVAAMRSFKYLRILLVAAEVLLLVVAVIIAVMTFVHLIDSDAATVALYRAMGASTDEIYIIYLLYLVELCLLAIVVAMVIAMLFVGGMALTSAGALAVRLKEFYNLSYLPKVVFYLFNQTFWWILVMILAVAPFSLFFSLRRFSPKHVAKKLKED